MLNLLIGFIVGTIFGWFLYIILEDYYQLQRYRQDKRLK